MDELKQILKQAFASSYSFYLKTQYFHWNVEGPLFPQLHEFFGKIYEEVYHSIDKFAEEIRTLRTYTPGSWSRFSQLSAVVDEERVPPARDMLEILLQDNEIVLTTLRSSYTLAEAEGQHGLSDFLAQRIDAHSKHSWMLRSTLK